MVDTFGTGTVPEAQIEPAVQKVFDLTPGYHHHHGGSAGLIGVQECLAVDRGGKSRTVSQSSLP